MPTLTIQLPRLHGPQAQIKSQAKRFNVLACGRRFGKTKLGIDRAIEPALNGFPTAWFAPTYKLLLEPWRDLRTVLKPITARISETERRIELVTGGSIDCWSLDAPDAGRGYKYARAILDEAAMVRDLEEAWNKCIRPTLTDYRGDAWFLSTPKGRNFFWRCWTMGQDPLQSEWMSWRFPTLSNPYIAPDEVLAAEHGIPERAYQQEYLAEFLEESGGVFRGIDACIDKGIKQPRPGCQGPFTIGADLARVEDFTVLSVTDGQNRQCDFERFNQISWERQINAIQAMAAKYPGARVRVDATGVGDPIFERLRKLGLRVEPFKFTNQSKEALIDDLAMTIEHQQIRLLDIPEQTAELQAYQYELTPSRNVRMNAPPGMHDDTVIALALSNRQRRPTGWSDALAMMD